MAISITCGCGKKLKAPDELAGKRVKCPACGAQMQAPQATDPPTVAVAPEEAASDLSDLLDERLREPAPTNCPHCGLTVVAGSTRCLRCGFDYQKGAVIVPPRPVSVPPSGTKKKPSKGGADENTLRDYLVSAGVIAAMIGVVYLGIGWFRGVQSRSVADELMKSQPPNAAMLEEKGAAAMPGLMAYLKGSDGGRRSRAAYVLGFIGDSASVAALSQQLGSDNDASHRVTVAEALARIGPTAQEATPALCEALQATEVEVRVASAGALGKIGSGAQEAVPALSAALQASEIEMRLAAARALGGYGKEAKAAVPALIRLLDVTDDDLCLAAAEGLGGIGLAAEPAQAALFKALDSTHPGMASAALRAVAQIAPKDPAVFAALEAGLKKEPTLIAAADSLARLGPAARAAVPALIEAQDRAETIVMNRSFMALQRRDNQPRTFRREFNAAGEMVSERTYGPDTSRPIMVSNDEPLAVRKALTSVADGTLATLVQAILDRQMAPVVDALQDPDVIVQRAAISVLALRHIDEVMLLLRDRRPAVRVGAATVLSKRPKQLEDSVARIRQLHAQGSAVESAAAIDKISPLLEALRDDNETVRTAIAELWRSLGTVGFLPPLIENPVLRESLEQALKP